MTNEASDRELVLTRLIGAPREMLYRAWTDLSSYEASFPVPGFTLFEQGPDRVWRPQRDFIFGAGGLPGPPEERFADHEGW